MPTTKQNAKAHAARKRKEPATSAKKGKSGRGARGKAARRSGAPKAMRRSRADNAPELPAAHSDAPASPTQRPVESVPASPAHVEHQLPAADPPSQGDQDRDRRLLQDLRTNQNRLDLIRHRREIRATMDEDDPQPVVDEDGVPLEGPGGHAIPDED